MIVPIAERWPGVALTDVATGASRFSLGLRFGKDVDAKKLKQDIEALDVSPWSLESVEVVNDAKGKRERALLDEVTWRPHAQEAHAGDAAVAAVVDAMKRAGSLADKAGLGEQSLDADAAVAALGWLDKQLAAVTEAIRKARVPGVPAEVRAVAYVNCHPRFRQFHFELRDGAADDDDWFPLEMPQATAALARWLDAAGAGVRRIPGVIWDSGAIDEQIDADYRCVVVDASS